MKLSKRGIALVAGAVLAACGGAGGQTGVERAAAEDPPQDAGDWAWIRDAYFRGSHSGSRPGVVARPVLTVVVNGYKIPDQRADRDFYLAEVTVEHTANMGGEFVFDARLCVDGRAGWYVIGRTLKITPVEQGVSNYVLEDWGPSMTPGSSTVAINVGASLSVGEKGPVVGINATYQRFYEIPDVKLEIPSPGSWKETFKGPGYPPDHTYFWSVDSPPPVSTGTFKSYGVVIFSTTDLLHGVRLDIEPFAMAIYDIIDWSVPCWWTITQDTANLSVSKSVTLLYNNPPSAPGMPSLKTPVAPNEAVDASTSGLDRDGDHLTFSFDFGDGTVTPFGSSTQTHAWTDPGTYGVRVKSMDSPHGAESGWSTTFLVDVRAPQGGGGGGGCATTGGAGWLLPVMLGLWRAARMLRRPGAR